MNAGEIAYELFGFADHLIESGEDPEDVRAAFCAVAIRLREISDEADADARNVILRNMQRAFPLQG